jgi:adenine-specific DNA-methyltransferase
MTIIESDTSLKLRGGYYTSSEVARWMCDWAIRDPSNTVLEPSCGGGEFLDAAARRFSQLGAGAEEIAKRLTGIEIVATEADAAS